VAAQREGAGTIRSQHGLNSQRLSWWRRRLDEQRAEAAIRLIPAELVQAPQLSRLAPPARRPASAVGPGTTVVVRLSGDVSVEAAGVGALPTAWVASLAAALTRAS
jgi:hypothetical protein